MNKPAKLGLDAKTAPQRAEEQPFAVHPGAIAGIVGATHGDPFAVLSVLKGRLT